MFNSDYAIGKLVKFKIPAIGGSSTVAGTIKRIFPDGNLEVKAQSGGYYIIDKSKVIKS